METIAVYWEPRIKTYGFQRIPDLALIEFSCPHSEIESLGEILSEDSLNIVRPKFVIAQEFNNEVSFILCLPFKESKEFHTSLEITSPSTVHEYIHPVSIIFFHGPHFGDRYGIANATFSSLSKAGMKIIASGCSSASVFLVVAQHDIDAAEKILSETFEVAK